jgi:very-short-patch-repair endonuclease
MRRKPLLLLSLGERLVRASDKVRPMPNSPHRKPQVRDDLLMHARRMRHEPTDAEQKLWSLLRGRRLGGYKFRRQHPVHGYIIDFYCDECRLGVELDGGQHLDLAARQQDAERARELLARGIRMLRFSDKDMLKDPDVVAKHIYAALAREDLGGREQPDARPHPNPLPEGEGIKQDRRGGAL